MKKKSLILIALAIVAVMTLVVAMTACSMTSGDANVADDYKQEQVEANMEQMRTNGGYKITYSVDATGNDGESSDSDSATFAYGAKGDVYYSYTPDQEAYFDLSAEDHAEFYVKENGTWKKTVKAYSDSWTKANAESEVKLETAAAAAYSKYYFDSDNTGADGGMEKGSGKVLGRDCDTYTFGVKAIVISYSSTIYVDKATGICLKWAIDGKVVGASVGVNFECKGFDTNPTFTLPEVSEENTTYEEASDEPAGDENEGELVAPEIVAAAQKANELRLSTGFYISYRTKLNDDVLTAVTIAAHGDAYYFSDGEYGRYYDLSAEGSYDVYTEQEDGTFVKETCAYDEDENKASFAASITTSLANITVSADVTSKRMVKTEDTFLSRDVFKYTLTERDTGSTESHVVIVDQATGMLLKHESSVTITLLGTTTTGTVECTEFRTEFSVDFSELELAEEE